MIELAARAVIEYGGEFLLVQLKGQDYWCLPGGRIEPNEPIIDGLRRELREELGIEQATVGKLLFVHQLMRGDEQTLEFFFHVQYDKQLEKLDLAATSHGDTELAGVQLMSLEGVNLLPAFLVDELPTVLARKFEVEAAFRVSSVV